MKKKPILALIIAAPSPLQDGLLALMTTFSQINAVFVAEDASLALRMVKDHRPNLILLDIHLLEAQMVLKCIKSQWPQTRCIVLVDNVEQEREVKEADAVLLEGLFPVTSSDNDRKPVGTIRIPIIRRVETKTKAGQIRKGDPAEMIR